MQTGDEKNHDKIHAGSRLLGPGRRSDGLIAQACAYGFLKKAMPISQRKPYRVGRSRTGLGLFATKPINKGTRIICYFGPLLDPRQADNVIENKYLFALNARWTIDGSVRRNIARYINHSCKPNAESEVKPRERQVFIRAVRNIEEGEEINYDYGVEYFDAYLKPIGCKCDACERKRRKRRAAARAERARLKSRRGKKSFKGCADASWRRLRAGCLTKR